MKSTITPQLRIKKPISLLVTILWSIMLVQAQEVPVFQWAKHTVAGPGDEYGNAITTDANGNVLITGEFTEIADFDPGAAVFNLTPVSNSRDIFISKLDATGNFLWAKSIGGPGLDAGTSISTDAAGNVFVTGYYSGSLDFDTGPGIFMMGSFTESFILKLDPDGNFIWAKSIDAGSASYITAHSSGFIYITGYFEGSADFDPGPGTFIISIPNSLGDGDVYVLKLDLDGNFVWARNLGDPSGASNPSDIAIGPLGEVITTGSFQSTSDFDPGPGTFNLVSAGNRDGFISKLDANGDFVWARSVGAASIDGVTGVGIDASGNIITAGIFVGTVDFDLGAGVSNLTSAGSTDIFVLKLDGAGNFVWATRTGSTSDDQANAMAMDENGDVYTTGYFRGTVDFNPGVGINNLVSAGNQDIFIQKLDAAGNYVWSTRTGSLSTDIGNAIHADIFGNVYLNSYFVQTADFDPTCGVANLSSAGSSDVFIQKLSIGFTPSITSFTPGTGPVGSSVTILGTDFSTTLTNNIVRFNGAFATVTAATATSLTAIVPTGATTGVITVRIGCYTGASATNFVVTMAAAPTITSFLPTSGPVGTTVTITGTNFSTTPTNNTVTFNGTAAVVTASTATSITTTVPVGATTGPITVTVAGNTATSAPNFTITSQNFITQWNLATAGSGATQLSFGTATSGVVNYTWQEISPGSASGSGSWSGATLTITGLPTGATIRLQIAPTNFQRININNGLDRSRLVQVEQWGSTAWTSMQNAFRGCRNMQVTATDVPDLSGVSNMSGMFSSCTNLNSPGNIGTWITSTVTNMAGMFSLASAFNQNINSWNTGAVTNMSALFDNAAAFNQDIGAWNTSSVTNMAGMFSGAVAFNRNIGAWNTSAVTNMNSMFYSAYRFNQNIGGWNTAVVTDMASMFGYAYDFNQNIGTWNTSAVTNMSRMFEDAFDFNQNIGAWNTSAVTNMRGMFIDAYAFNQNIGTWNTSAVINMERMFDFATGFNQNIGTWNTSAVTDMRGMFADANAFNQNIGTWTLNPAVNLSNMLNNNGMDCNNYSATLIGWSSNPSTPNGRTLGATGRQYGTNSAAARTNLAVSKGWTITGDTPSGADCSLVSLPTISSFTPTSGLVGTSVAITGTNFDLTPANNIVMFNGTAATVTASTATSITTTVPIGATTGTITVIVAGNTATSATDFTVTAPTATIIITQQPVFTYVCEGSTATFSVDATGTTNIIYKWQKYNGSDFADINDDGDYSGTHTKTLSINTAATGFGGNGEYRCRINGDLATEVFSDGPQLTINGLPSPPDVISSTSCGSGSVTLTASGGSPGDYQWYSTSPLTIISGETDEIYTTPILSASTPYAVTVSDIFCKSLPANVTAVINTLPAKPVVTSSVTAVGNAITICSTTALTLSAPVSFNSYLWSDGSLTQQISVTTAGVYSVMTSDAQGCSSPASDGLTVTIVPAPCNNSAPVINPTSVTTTIGSQTSINLLDLISDADDNVVLSSLIVLVQPISGASATITNSVLMVDYTGINFTGPDQLTIQVCDVFGECTQQQIEVDVIGDIEVFTGISPNEDLYNEKWVIQNIETLPDTRENKVSIYNRWGDLIWETSNYNNDANFFSGLNKNGDEVTSGVYFYKIKFNGDRKEITGYLTLKR